MARPDREALLVLPGDSAALAAALQQVLATPEISANLASQARARVGEFALQAVLPRHLALARTLAPL
jgi:glycosyltransferase involved in cell wall biosynthesis